MTWVIWYNADDILRDDVRLLVVTFLTGFKQSIKRDFLIKYNVYV